MDNITKNQFLRKMQGAESVELVDFTKHKIPSGFLLYLFTKGKNPRYCACMNSQGIVTPWLPAYAVTLKNASFVILESEEGWRPLHVETLCTTKDWFSGAYSYSMHLPEVCTIISPSGTRATFDRSGTLSPWQY